jgi:hypothetical protein
LRALTREGYVRCSGATSAALDAHTHFVWLGLRVQHAWETTAVVARCEEH